jgi:hypothetical protein
VGIIRHYVIVDVVDSTKTVSRSVWAAFGGVVVDHVEDDLDASLVEGMNHRAEFLAGIPGIRRIVMVRGEKVQRPDTGLESRRFCM